MKLQKNIYNNYFNILLNIFMDLFIITIKVFTKDFKDFLKQQFLFIKIIHQTRNFQVNLVIINLIKINFNFATKQG